MKITIIGASGSGTTTLAKSLAAKLGWKHLDVDEYYWEKTAVPFTNKVAPGERNNNLQRDFELADKAIVSGSLISWGPYWNKVFDLAIFLKLPPALRMERLKNREAERYGDELNTNEMLQQKSAEFLEWARQYDDELFAGRSITLQKEWIALLNCECLEIDGDFTNEERMEMVIGKIKSLSRLSARL